ncbi:MAG: hypothetical protein IPL84_08760 [Chitinophagaceae bacterium]|nr:hypothetical protein [Chitinophagaceae bacterium]
MKEVEAFIMEGKVQKPETFFLTEKARAYLRLKRYDSDIQTIKLVKVAEKTFNKDVSDNYDILSKAYEGLGDYKNAMKNYKLHGQAEDTLAKWRNSSEATRLELEYQFTQQQLKSKLVFQTQMDRQKSTRTGSSFQAFQPCCLPWDYLPGFDIPGKPKNYCNTKTKSSGPKRKKPKPVKKPSISFSPI